MGGRGAAGPGGEGGSSLVVVGAVVGAAAGEAEGLLDGADRAFEVPHGVPARGPWRGRGVGWGERTGTERERGMGAGPGQADVEVAVGMAGLVLHHGVVDLGRSRELPPRPVLLRHFVRAAGLGFRLARWNFCRRRRRSKRRTGEGI